MISLTIIKIIHNHINKILERRDDGNHAFVSAE